jgi:hypothetical protein
MTWHDIAEVYPVFVQWIVAKYGPLPDGEVSEEDYERFSAAYNQRAIN